MTREQKWAALQDPSAKPELLAEIAAQHPELSSHVAAHPQAYAELLEWLLHFGDETTQNIAWNRLKNFSQTTAAPQQWFEPPINIAPEPERVELETTQAEAAHSSAVETDETMIRELGFDTTALRQIRAEPSAIQLEKRQKIFWIIVAAAASALAIAAIAMLIIVN